MHVARSTPRALVRAFLAVDVGPDIRAELRGTVAELKRLGADLRWVAEENWHLTVKFLGEVEWLRTGEIGKAAQEAVGGLAPFELSLRGLQAFPPNRAPRVVAAGVATGLEQLAALHAPLDECMAAFGVAPERRAFQAHLTLARVNSQRGAERLWQALPKWQDQDWGSVVVEEVILFQSELQPQGPLYTPLARAKLGQAGR